MVMRLSLCLALGMFSCVYAEVQLSVSPDAQPGGDGSRFKPYQTLVQARDGIRALRKAGKLKSNEPVTVFIESGNYPMNASFELTAADSGTAQAPVIYRARENGKARLLGGIVLEPASFKPVTEKSVLSRLDATVRDKVKVYDLSAKVPAAFPEFRTAFQGSPAAPWLYVNHQPMTLARWPNLTPTHSGWAGFSKAVDTGLPKPEAADPALRKAHPGSFIFDDPRPAHWNLSEGVWLLGYWTHDWSDEVIRIASYDKEKKVIALAAPHGYGINGGTWGAAQRRFFAMNALEELDAPGEWYLDRSRKLLYFYPEEDLSKSEIVLATLTQALVKANGAKHVSFVGLDFGFAHADGIMAHNVEHLEIVGCVVANLAGSAISLQGSGNVVRSCDIFNLGRGGVSLNGGDRKLLTPAKNSAENNHIHHYGIFQRTYAAGINAHGCGQIVSNNCIHDAPHNAVLYGGNEHLFERNEIYRVVMETGDAGAFYTGRDWTSQGNILRHNFIHDLGGGDAKHVNTMGVYLDDCDCGDTIAGNVFYRAGRAIMIGGGRDNPVLNNLVVSCPIGLHIDARGMTWKQWNNPSDKSWCLEERAQQFNYTKPPWSTKYPRLATIMKEDPRQPLGNSVRRNVFVDCSRQFCDFDGNVKKLIDKLEIGDNLAVNRLGITKGLARAVPFKGFTNLAGTRDKPIDLRGDGLTAQDFSSRWGTWLKKEVPSFEPIPFEKIGLYKDVYRHTLPDREVAREFPEVFKDGETVSFLGDSITAGGRYQTMIADFYLTRFPDRTIQFVNAGRSGDSAGGSLGRLKEDVIDKKPGTVVIMFGMNDVNRGAYVAKLDENKRKAQQQALDGYKANLEKVVGRIRAEAGEPQLLLVTPSPFDQTVVLQKENNQPGCNDGLGRCAAVVKELAAKNNGKVVDFHGPMTALNLEQQKRDPKWTIVGGDRVHPGAPGHLMMAWLFLKAQGVPSVVSKVTVDAGAGRATESLNAKVTAVQKEGGNLAFTVLEKALPFPIDPAAKTILEILPIEKDLNQEILAVTSLAEGLYEVRIDGTAVGRHTAADLARGINLALNPATPQYKQAQNVARHNEQRRNAESQACSLLNTRRWMQSHYKVNVDDPAALKKHYESFKDKSEYNAVMALNYMKKWSQYGDLRKEVTAHENEALANRIPVPHRYAIVRIESGK